MEEPLSQYEIDFLQRTTEARAGRYTQQEIADLLGISQSRYSKYEIRTPLPHAFVPQFCTATGVEANWLFGVRAGALDREVGALGGKTRLDPIRTTPAKAG